MTTFKSNRFSVTGVAFDFGPLAPSSGQSADMRSLTAVPVVDTGAGVSQLLSDLQKENQFSNAKIILIYHK